MHIFQKRNYSRKERLESPPFFLLIYIFISWIRSSALSEKPKTRDLTRRIFNDCEVSVPALDCLYSHGKEVCLQPRVSNQEPTKAVWSLPWQMLLFYRPQTPSASCPSAAWVSSLHRFCEQPSTFQIGLFCLNWWELVSAPCRQRPLTEIPMLTPEDTEARSDSINWQTLHNWLVEQQRKDA